jgi:diaminopimelate epimerase
MSEPTEISFAKLHAAGNGYIAINGRGWSADLGALARAMTDPYTGIGSDGLLIAEESRTGQVRMRVFNSDGSESERSGNGIRLFAKFILDRNIGRVVDRNRGWGPHRVAQHAKWGDGGRSSCDGRADF